MSGRFTVFQIGGLIFGSCLLLGLGFVAGAVVRGPGEPSAAGHETASAEGARPAAAGEAANPASGSDAGGPARRSSLERIYDQQTYKTSYNASEKVGDTAAEKVMGATEPGTERLTEGAQEVLPASLAQHVPWLAGTAAFYAHSAVKEGVGEAANDRMLESAERAKNPSGEGEAGEGGEGAKAAEPGAERSAASGAERPGAPAAGADEGRAVGAEAAATAPAGDASVGHAVWSVELGRFATLFNANDFSADVGRRGVDAQVAFEDGADGRRWYAVRAGSYPDRTAAAAALGRLRGMGFDGSLISEAAGHGGGR